MWKRISVAVVGLFALILGGCLSSPEETPPQKVLEQQLAVVDQTQLALDLQIIDDTLDARQITNVLIEENGVRYVIHEMGSGKMPKLGNAIKVNYTLHYLSKGTDGGTVISSANGYSEYLKNLIIAWKLVLPLVPEGTSLTMYVPSGFAYGPYDVPDGSGGVAIPADTNLVFEIDFLAIL